MDTVQGGKGTLDPADPAQVAAGLDRGAAEAGDYRKQAHLARVAARLDLREVITALDAEEARGSLGVRREVTEALLARFAEIDPAAATVRAAALYEKSAGYWSWIETPLAFWWKRDARAAQAWANGLPPGSLRSSVQIDLAEFLAVSDPEEALRRGLAQNDKLLSGWNVRDLFTALAEGDLSRAAENARAVPRHANRDEAVEGVLKVWVARDPAAAYAWVNTTANSRSAHDTDVDNFYQLWSEQDPAAAGAWALAHELAPGRRDKWNHGFDHIVANMADRDAVMAQGFVAQLPGWAQEDARKQLCKEWKQKDPLAAANYALSLGDRKDGGASELTLGCVGDWAENDLEGARAWTERMPPGKARAEAMAKVCEQWTRTDPKGCADYLLAHQSDADEPLAKNDSFHDAAGEWAEENPDEMLRWSQALPDVDARDAVLTNGASRLADEDLSKAAQMIAAISPAGRGNAVKEVVENLKERVTEAKSLVEALPNDQTAVEATQKLAEQWSAKDMAAAAAWVASRPAGPARDGAAFEIASGVMDKQGIAAAEQTVALVQDPKQKAKTLESVAYIYLDKDRAAAKAWVATSPLFTPKLRAKWLREAEKSRDEQSDGQDDD